MWKYYFLISSCLLEISYSRTSVGKINIIGSSSSIFQFEGRVWFEEPEIITGTRKAKVDEAIVELLSILWVSIQIWPLMMDFSGHLSLSDPVWFEGSTLQLLKFSLMSSKRKSHSRNTILKSKLDGVTENKWEKSIESNKKLGIRFQFFKVKYKNYKFSSYCNIFVHYN